MSGIDKHLVIEMLFRMYGRKMKELLQIPIKSEASVDAAEYGNGDVREYLESLSVKEVEQFLIELLKQENSISDVEANGAHVSPVNLEGLHDQRGVNVDEYLTDHPVAAGADTRSKEQGMNEGSKELSGQSFSAQVQKSLQVESKEQEARALLGLGKTNEENPITNLEYESESYTEDYESQLSESSEATNSERNFISPNFNTNAIGLNRRAQSPIQALNDENRNRQPASEHDQRFPSSVSLQGAVPSTQIQIHEETINNLSQVLVDLVPLVNRERHCSSCSNLESQIRMLRQEAAVFKQHCTASEQVINTLNKEKQNLLAILFLLREKIREKTEEIEQSKQDHENTREQLRVVEDERDKAYKSAYEFAEERRIQVSELQTKVVRLMDSLFSFIGIGYIQLDGGLRHLQQKLGLSFCTGHVVDTMVLGKKEDEVD